MNRNLKSLGLLTGALLAMMGLMASTAGAHTPARFTTEQQTTTVKGVHDPGTAAVVLKITGQEVACGTENYHGHAAETSLESVTASPTYTECVAFGFVGAKVTGFGHYPEQEGAGPYCDFLFDASGTLDLVCPTGLDVTIVAGTCTVHIPAQENLSTITYTTDTWNVKHALTLHINLEGITTNHTDGFACTLPSGGESATAVAIGTARVWGEDATSGNTVGITWDATVA